MSAVPPTMYEPPPAARPGAYGTTAARGFDLPAFLRRWFGWLLGAAVLLVWWTCTRPSGLGACELLYVEEIQVGDRVYR